MAAFMGRELLEIGPETERGAEGGFVISFVIKTVMGAGGGGTLEGRGGELAAGGSSFDPPQALKNVIDMFC